MLLHYTYSHLAAHVEYDIYRDVTKQMSEIYFIQKLNKNAVVA